jgi:hypothetical protein
MRQYATDPVTALVGMLKGIEKIDPILIVFENSLLLIAAGHEMIHPVRVHCSDPVIDLTKGASPTERRPSTCRSLF